MRALPPVIKWFGSKRVVAEQLSKYILKSSTYFEPFVGGGALIPFAKSEFGIASDIIPELISLWNEIKNNPSTVADEYESRWKQMQNEGPHVYYEVRDRFNATKNCYDFLFLTRTCVNGMIRYNENGEFNNSLHLSRPGINPATLRNIICQWNLAVRHFTFLNVDYRECLTVVKAGDFVFLDPPYGGTKDRYLKEEFNLSDFFSELERLNSIGAHWMLTFDGTSGERRYDFAPPVDLYSTKFSINTGNSSFAKLIEKKKQQIQESVYLNFDCADFVSYSFNTAYQASLFG